MDPTNSASVKSPFASGKPPRPGIAKGGSFIGDTLDVSGDAVSDSWLPGGNSPFAQAGSMGFGPLPDPAIPVIGSAAASPSATAPASLTQVLWLQETGTSAPISVTDINQGQMGDCYLLSSIGELALFHPGWITNIIRANADGTETVTLFRAANGALPGIGTAAYTPVAIDVTNSFPSNSVNNGATQGVLNGQKEIWVQVLEKAAATLNGGYNGIANGGIPSISMEELTGCSAMSTSAAAISSQQLQADVAAGDLITFDTGWAGGTLPYGLYGDHAYMFQSLTTVNGTVMLNLLNPWGFDQPNPIPFSQIGTVCDEVDIGQVTKTTPSGPTLAHQTADQTWAQGSHVSLTLPAGVFNEASGAKLIYAASLASGQACPSWLTFNAATLTFSGTVPGGMEILSLKVTATDPNGASCSEIFKATVPAAPPVLVVQTAAQTWTEGAKLTFLLPANTFADPNAEALGYTATLSAGQTLPSWLTMNSTNGAFSGTVGYTSGPLSIKVIATDTSGLSASETFQVSVAVPPPVVANPTPDQIWTAGKPLSLALASGAFAAVPGQTLKYAATLPVGLTINASTGTISGIVQFAPGVDRVTVTATQTNGLSVTEGFNATVVAAAPVVRQTQTQTWTANQSVSLSVAAAFSDPQGESLTYAAVLSGGKALPAGLTFNPATASFGGIAPTQPGSLAITVSAKDQSGLTASETIQCVVAARAPIAGVPPATQYWTANKAVSFALPANTFTDPQGEKLTYAATQANGSALPGGLTFNAATDAFGGIAPITPETLGLRVTATDASGLSASETFSAIIQAAAPVLAHQTANQVWTAGSVMSFLIPPNTFADPQSAAMSFAAYETSGSDQTSWLRFAAGLAGFAGTVPMGLTGTIGVRIVATDAYGLSTSESFGVTFAPAGGHLTAVGQPAMTEMLAFHG